MNDVMPKQLTGGKPMKRTSYLIPGIVGVVLAWHGFYWGLAITFVCVALAWDRAGKQAAARTPEQTRRQLDWLHAPKHLWTAPATGQYKLDSPEGFVIEKIKRGTKLWIRDEAPEPTRVA